MKNLDMEALSGLDDRFSFSKLTREEELAEVAFYEKYYQSKPDVEEAIEEVNLQNFILVG